MRLNDQSGFTLPELILASGFFIAVIALSLLLIYPKNFTPILRNAQRRTDAAMIVQGINRYEVANNSLPPGITTNPQIIGSFVSEINLCPALVPTYMSKMPIDPLLGSKTSCKPGTGYISGFSVSTTKSGNNIIVSSDGAENKVVIKVNN